MTWDTEAWGGMTLEEATYFTTDNIINGNLADAISFIMHDGDVRPDSVKLALRVLCELQLQQIRSSTDIANHLIRLIDSWETT